MWFHFINVVSNEISSKTMSVRIKYRPGNIIGLVVHRVCSAWTTLMVLVGTKALSVQLLPLLCYNDEQGVLAFSDRRSCPSKPASVVKQSIRPLKSGGEVDAIASGRNDEMDHKVRYLAIAFLSKLRQIVCSNTNTIHTLEDCALL